MLGYIGSMETEMVHCLNYCSAEKLVKMLKNAYEKNVNSIEEWKVLRKELNEKNKKFNTCKKYKKTPTLPVVDMTFAINFNEQMQIDMGVTDGENFLVMVDTSTRYTWGYCLKSMDSEEKMKKWICYFGSKKKNAHRRW